MPRALRSLPGGVTAFVLDAHSKDATVPLARELGATVILRHWTNFVDARLYALAHVRTDWTLMLDADEEVDATLRDAIVGAHDDREGYTFARTTLFCNRPIRMWSREPLLRLFRTGSGRLRAAPVAGGTAQVHERWSCDGRTGPLPGTLLHHSYPTLASYREKFERYTTIEAQHGRRPQRWAFGWLFLLAAARFFGMLFVRGEVLDGWRGLYVAWFSAFYPVAVALKRYRGA